MAVLLIEYKRVLLLANAIIAVDARVLFRCEPLPLSNVYRE